MALSADSRPRSTIVAAFTANMSAGAAQLFRDVLLMRNEQGLIGREMFAVNGASTSGTARCQASGQRIWILMTLRR